MYVCMYAYYSHVCTYVCMNMCMYVPVCMYVGTSMLPTVYHSNKYPYITLVARYIPPPHPCPVPIIYNIPYSDWWLLNFSLLRKLNMRVTSVYFCLLLLVCLPAESAHTQIFCQLCFESCPHTHHLKQQYTKTLQKVHYR